jgi:hypothetical protein
MGGNARKKSAEGNDTPPGFRKGLALTGGKPLTLSEQFSNHFYPGVAVLRTAPPSVATEAVAPSSVTALRAWVLPRSIYYLQY